MLTKVQVLVVNVLYTKEKGIFWVPDAIAGHLIAVLGFLKCTGFLPEVHQTNFLSYQLLRHGVFLFLNSELKVSTINFSIR